MGQARGSVAVLTDEGLAVLENAAPGHVDTVRSLLFDRLTPEQVGQLEQIFTQVAQGLQGEDGEAAPEDLPWRRRSSPCSGSE
ncbi:DNA-binding MarR family transcriptional regulator [Streptomyces phaeoluteigriseus]